MNGKQLRQLRRGKLDMTQEQLASSLGLSVRFISDCENRLEEIPKYLAVGAEGLAHIKNAVSK